MPRVQNGDMKQNLGCSFPGSKSIKGGLFSCGHHLGVERRYRQYSGSAGFSRGGFRHNGQVGFSYRLSQRRLTVRINSRRSDHDKISNLERLVRRTVKSEEEQEKKEEFVEKEEPKPLAVTPKYIQLGALVAGARGMLMTVRILTAMMTWVVLFFIVSVWDGDSKSFQDRGKKKGKRGPRR
ncbi:hypothetical protein R1sor_023403 [Riccia sorocarpa]|uniref:Transmembrane protein n=1 Tax=Riccia sorocarpa TaxID=122646 RepID=A0ABD3GMK9_9MARC